MTIKTIKVRTASGAFDVLETQSKGWNRFRGHQNAEWKLKSTLARHFITPPSRTTVFDISNMIDHFLVNLASIGITVPFDKNDLRGRLEYARHYGLPSPLIDFSMSPYVALFFAFNGVRPSQASSKDCSAVYCINIFELAGIWAHIKAKRDLNGKIVDGAEVANLHNSFKFDHNKTFETGYPIHVLNYLEYPASWNRRMIRQLGVFIYDTMNYQMLGYSDLEEFLNQPEIPGPTNYPVLTKVIIPHRVGREIMERLEMVGAKGTLLFEDHEGAVFDVVNSYNYGRRTGHAWDIQSRSSS